MQRIALLIALLVFVPLIGGCSQPEKLPTPTYVAHRASPAITTTPVHEPTTKPSAATTQTLTPTASATRTRTNTRTPTVTFTPSVTHSATPTATKPVPTLRPEQLVLKHFQEGREWLNATHPEDVPKGASQYFTGKALQQTLEEAQWEIGNRARYKIGDLTDKLWSALSNEGALIVETTRAGKAVQYDENWKPLNEFDVNPLSIVYVMTFDAKERRWKVDHTKSAVDKVTGKSLLEL